MAALTTQRSGNWSDTNAGTMPWTALTGSGTGGVPGAGDTVTIGNGHTVVVDVDSIAGSNSANVGHAITINGSSSSSYGTLQVPSGVNLELRGRDTTSNLMMLINRYGLFEALDGSTITANNLTGSYTSQITNNGRVRAIGTALNGITFKSIESSVNWAVQVTNDSKAAARYRPGGADKWVFNASSQWFSNAAGTGPASIGDSSLSISVSVGTVTFTNEVASVDLIVSAGDYYVNYVKGIIFCYLTGVAPTVLLTYKRGSPASTWGIDSSANTTYNSGIFRYCTFKYMGAKTTVEQHVLKFRYKYAPTVQANREVEVTNCTFSNCYHCVNLRDITGSASDYVLMENNTFNEPVGEAIYGYAFAMPFSPAVYVSFSGNTLNMENYFIAVNASGSTVNHKGIKINNNTGTSNTIFYNGAPIGVNLSDICTCEGAQMTGNNVISDAATGENMIMHFGGNATARAVVEDNIFSNSTRLINVASYLTVRRNKFMYFLHHGVIGPASWDNVYVTDFRYENNVHIGGCGDAPYIQFGYNHFFYLNKWEIVNNTFNGGGIEFGDVLDVINNTLITNAIISNNLIVNGTASAGAGGPYGIRKPTDTTQLRTRCHVLALNYNSIYNTTTPYTNITNQATFVKSGTPYNFDATRNVLGVALWDSTAVTPPTNKSLVFTVNAAGSDETLAWDGGTPVQLVFGTGTATSGSSTTLTNSGASWSTLRDNANCPQALFVKITGGTGAGQIRAITNNTATALTCTPAFSPAPNATSTYTIYQTEVKLFDSGATDYVRAGIYLPELPTTSQTDTGISVTYNSVLTDPQLPCGTTISDETIAGHIPPSTSPVIDAGTSQSAPTEDYRGFPRPLGSGYDIGCIEYMASMIFQRVQSVTSVSSITSHST